MARCEAGWRDWQVCCNFPSETFRVLKEKELRQYGEYRTRRLVLEAWERLSASGELPEPYGSESATESPKRETITLRETRPVVESKPAPAQEQIKLPPKPAEPPKEEVDAPAGQLPLTDFGLYKCELCGKMVLGFDRESHARETHHGKSVEWKRVR